MGILAAALHASAGDPFDDRYYSLPTGSMGGVTRSDDAMGVPAYFGGVAMISEDIAKVPLPVFENLDSGGRAPAPYHFLDELLNGSPNPWQHAYAFREMMTAFSINRGKGVAEIIPGPKGPVGQIVPLHPDLVREETQPVHRFIYRDPKLGGRERTILPDEAFVLRGRLGMSVPETMGSTIGLEIAQEKYAGFLFSRGARFQGILTHPKTASETVRMGLRKGLDDFTVNGPKSGRPLLLEEGMTWQNVSLTSKDAQFIENRMFGLRQIARGLRIPPTKLADSEYATYSNVEQEAINYVVDCLLGWAIRWEQAIRHDLIVNVARFFVRHNLDGLLRGDMAARSQAYSLAIQWGWMTRNEVRAKENMNPIAGLDAPLTPLNMTADPTGTTTSPAALGHLRLLASDSASRVIRRELSAVSKAAEDATCPEQFRAKVDDFYRGHVEFVAGALHIPEYVARQFAADQRTQVLTGGAAAMADWAVDRVEHLTRLAMAQAGALAA